MLGRVWALMEAVLNLVRRCLKGIGLYKAMQVCWLLVPSGQDPCLGHLSFLDSTVLARGEDWQCSRRQVRILGVLTAVLDETALCLVGGNHSRRRVEVLEPICHRAMM